ncbi:hypothetical protein [Phenylobacterium sp.]|uniref:hypothetical protein n=1 Tax=Phenylobacterium sp. TaxID=1871053 RepID=UPI0026065CFC|nr:hypothetical protein [Phenylobacterium sp.]
MRMAVTGGVLSALLPTLALAETKVDLGDGVSVVFPSAPAKMHTTSEPPAGPAKGAGTESIRSVDTWMLRIGGATFRATAMTPREQPGAPRATCGDPPLPVPPGTISPCDSVGRDLASPPEERRVMGNGAVVLIRTVKVNGHIYGVTFMRSGEGQLATLDPSHETPPESVGEAFVSSFKVATPPAK